uniref:EF-hand domain-containing protein n=1 Tax=Tetradesmus obliquus TaxID=3088 RepID=A0A383V370_TETOB|eukprot:jgi/Sobl393_1/250/SZX60038.1
MQAQAQKPPWAARMPTWSPSTRMHLNHLMDLFTICDKDGNGILDREEVRHLLQSDGRCTAGICMIAQHRWLSEPDLDEIMSLYDTTNRGGLSFSEFMELVLDGVLLDGKFEEYRAVFSAADEDGDGFLCIEEMAAVLQQLGRPISPQEVADIMAAADGDGNALIDFNEWLRLFRGQLLDLPRMLRYMKMKPVVLGDEVPPAAAMARSLTSGGLTLVSGGAQLGAVMDGLPPATLLVALFGLSGDPICQATAGAVRDLAVHYHKATFVAVEIDRSPEAKALFKHVLLGRYVPAFYFFRGGQLLHSHADASAAVLERYLREHLPATEQPVQPVLQQQHQRQHKKQQQQGPMGLASASSSSSSSSSSSTATRGYSLADLVYDSPTVS